MRRTLRYTIALSSLALTLPLALIGDRADAYSWFQYGGQNVVWFGAASDRYLSPTAFPIGSITETLILESMGLWNIVPGSNFEYAYINLDQDYPIDNFDGYSDTAAVPTSSLDPGVLGVTYLVNSGPEWFDMDVVFSDDPGGVGYSLEANPDCDQVTNPTPTNGYSFLLVAVHEMGHALGLGHDPIGNESPSTPWFVATMNPRYPSGGPFGQENIVELHADDRNGARFLYPHSGPSSTPLVDLASAGYSSSSVLGKAVPVACGPSGVEPGDELICSSVLENLGITNEFYVRQGFYLSTDANITTGDTFLGELRWDIAAGDAFEFDVAIDMPADIASGGYYVGAIFDDLNEIDEEYEDNNAVSYCQPITVNQLAPVFEELGQELILCGVPYTGPTPAVDFPLNMAPITWSIDNPASGMTIHPNSGIISWPSPIRSPFLYTIFVRATNGAGTSTKVLYLGVDSAVPVIQSIADQSAACMQSYTGLQPMVTSPGCMTPIIDWSLEQAPPGMTINHATGVVSWPQPLPRETPYTVVIRATNTAGNGTRSWQLAVAAGDIDLLVNCLSGPYTATGAGCTCADVDGDADVDLADFAGLQRGWNH